jgi:hypothetical protein
VPVRFVCSKCKTESVVVGSGTALDGWMSLDLQRLGKHDLCDGCLHELAVFLGEPEGAVAAPVPQAHLDGTGPDTPMAHVVPEVLSG